ncbi:unnamed protein product [Caenorhabditis auriculariae]|uniref:Nucleotide-diphospho-sugar transferase domain-containing protein n=1 Tax=Caenorhabditis auriculariae TaxID=2777116 RepID=A0A8S1HHX6_9PELO|nr:unnamed protein product [Caenorhabditis auriculariae]
MNRTLGEGKVNRIAKKNAVIEHERVGEVYFPLAAANVSSPCTDLREKFQPDETVIFTAQKHEDNGNARYVASSVVKRRELINCTGRITEICEKFCYVEARKYGRVFVPYSAKDSCLTKPWLGKGAVANKPCTLKIFRQPDINQCKYVAWSISINEKEEVNRTHLSSLSLSNGASPNGMTKLGNTNGQLRGAEKQPDKATSQYGVFVSCPTAPGSDYLLYSSQTGLAVVTTNRRQKWMEMGRFAKYDAMKVENSEKCHWEARNFIDLGCLFKVLDDYNDPNKLVLELPAVVNRISSSIRCAWLWNDFVGRIYVPSAQYMRSLKAMTCVRIRAYWAGTFEDVPWNATHIEFIGEDDVTRSAFSQLLRTDDDWVVKYIQAQQGQNFYGFLDNPKYGSAFIAWTDLTEGEVPPQVNTKCRVTVYHQQRDKKHAWRAVLVTPLDENAQPVYYHPIYNHTGQLTLPEPFVPPQASPPRAAPIAAPPGIPPLPNPSFGVIGSGLTNGHSHLPPSPPASTDSPAPPNAVASPPPKAPEENPTVSLDLGSLRLPDLSSSMFPWNNNDLLASTWSNTLSSSVGRENNVNFMSPFEESTFGMNLYEGFLPWKKDAETQTDVMPEVKILQDLLRCAQWKNLIAERDEEMNRAAGQYLRTVVVPLATVYVILHVVFYLHSLVNVDNVRVDFKNLKEGPLVMKDGMVVKSGKIIKGIGRGRLAYDAKLSKQQFHSKAAVEEKVPSIDLFHKIYLKNTAKKKYKNGNGTDFVYFLFVNDAYERLTRNWLCNTAVIPGIHENLIVMSLEQQVCDTIHDEWDNVVECLTIKINNYKEALDWGAQKYINMLTMRAQMMLMIAETDVPFVVVESDAVWFSDPAPLFRNRSAAEDADIIVPVKGHVEKGDALAFSPMLALATNATKTLLAELVRRLEADPTSYDQDVLNELCSKQFNGVVCRTFEYNEISDGKWFKLSENEKKQTRPVIVNNNFYVGVKHKESRQALAGLWFLSTRGQHCLLGKTRRMLREFFEPPVVA